MSNTYPPALAATGPPAELMTSWDGSEKYLKKPLDKTADVADTLLVQENTYKEGAEMAAQILCPGCRTATVPSVSWDFYQTSVRVTVCGRCQEAGLLFVNVRTPAMASLALPEFNYRHRDGLVEFAGATL